MFSCFGFQVFLILSLKMPYSSVLKWPPQSPDLTPCDFFSLGLCERFSLHPSSAHKRSVRSHKRYVPVLETATKDMLQRVWDELGYRLDVCRVAGGAHIENL